MMSVLQTCESPLGDAGGAFGRSQSIRGESVSVRLNATGAAQPPLVEVDVVVPVPCPVRLAALSSFH